MTYHPPADVRITEDVVRDLLVQAPSYAELPLEYAGHGWDNEIWRLGDDLVVRLPRRASAEQLLINEIAWLPQLAATIPLPIPAAIFAGRQTERFPYVWAITPWMTGQPASTWSPAERDGYAAQLAGVLRGLHEPAPPGGPVNEVRGGALADRVPYAIERLTGREDAPLLIAQLSQSVHAPAYAGQPRWLHGDPHPYNMLVDAAQLSALIDFGDITTGDPASDLGVAWLHFTREGRARFFVAYGADDALQTRARGWAICFASFMTRLEPEHPLRACGNHAIRELLASP